MRYLNFTVIVFAFFMNACEMPPQISDSKPKGEVTIYSGNVITMEPTYPSAAAIAVYDGKIVGIGDPSDLNEAFVQTRLDDRFAEKTIVPGFIDPHVHMTLAAIQYALPVAPPWQMATRDGLIEGYPTRAAFLDAVQKIEASQPDEKPLIIYGYHNLVHGELALQTLDEITSRPLFIWHYSSHDFYLNSAGLRFAKITPQMHQKYEGIDVDADGNLTGRIFEDALPYLLATIAPLMLAPEMLARGADNFSTLLTRGGVTAVAELGYGIFGLKTENVHIKNNWKSAQTAGYRLFLVPEHRAFTAQFGAEKINIIKNMIARPHTTPAPVLPQVKFFTDGAFYSQTMRLNPPGYLSGQSAGTLGLWVSTPSKIAELMAPYWTAGFDIHVHSNGDAAQDATLEALGTLRRSNTKNRFVFEHGGLFSPRQIKRVAELDGSISAASHYVFYMGELYQKPLGSKRGAWISPLNSFVKKRVPVALHSDAPLAPPLPLQAAAVHATRSTREKNVLTPSEKLKPYDALKAITFNAAYMLGLENKIGSIALNKYADFTILEENPLKVEPAKWKKIPVWGTILNGQVRPRAR